VADTIKTQFGFQSTALDVIAGVDLRGRRALVTGGSAGIGAETARALAKGGAEVTLTARNVEAGSRVVEEILRTTGNDKVFVRPLDLSDVASIDAFLGSWTGPLDILVNNAGMMGFPELRRSPRGYELQFATNHLGHFRLALGLHAALKRSGGARIVSLSSRGHLRSPVVFDDVHFVSRPYDPWLAYGQSKTANVSQTPRFR
jgi:NAD(P)-dependent dehydrogenase (short-subunit alcohol dehydrogenase family)